MSADPLQMENDELRRRLEEAEDTLRAIRSGGVDALLIEDAGARRVYTLEGADRPYRLFVERMQQGAATLLADGTIVFCNNQLAHLLRVPAERLVGAGLHAFVAPADRAVYDNLLWQGRTRAGQGEAHLRRADGGLVPAYLTFGALPADCGAAVGVLVTDLTAQKHQEQLAAAHAALRESEARYRTLVEQVKDYAIFRTDPAGKATTWNEGVRRVLGFEEAEFVGRDVVATIFTPEDLAAGIPQRELDTAARTGSASNDRWMRRKDGTRFFALGATTALRDAAGRLLGFTKVMRDQSDRKRLEDELRQVAADLSAAARGKDEFLAMLAHELRNPLAPLRNAVYLLRHSHGDLPAVRSMADLLDRQLTQMVRLVDDLLDVSRLSRGKIELRTQRVDLVGLVRHAIEAARATAECRDRELTAELPPDPIPLTADPTRLAQVVGNLLNNACKFTGPGGRIGVTVEPPGGRPEAVVRVRDTGIGMAPDELPRIFDMFTQLDTSLERSQSGLGIGLTLVRKLVEMHGGTVAAHSEGPGRGSEFVVRLPVTRSAELGSRNEESGEFRIPSSALGDRKRILVVDDNQDAADSLATLLELDGHEVRTTHDGLAAADLAADWRPDVVLLDIGLPKLNGYEVARRIRDDRGPGVLLVALTGWGQETDRRRSAAAGFDHHLVKPVEPDALAALLGG